jgi:hypothetical protein
VAILPRAPDEVTEIDRKESLRANDALKSLARSLALSEGFALHLLVCESIADVPVALDVLRDALEARGRPVEWLHLDPYPTPETKVTEEWLESNVLLRLAAERATPPDEREVVVLHAEGIPFDPRGLWAGFFNRMNRARNLIVRRLGVPLILVVAPETESLFAEAAPDFWSGRSGVCRIDLPVARSELLSGVPFMDVSRLGGALSARAACVCRVEIGGQPYGTGFLVGPDIVLTSHFIVRTLIEHPTLASAARLRFDFFREGDQIKPGIGFELAPDWLLDASPPGAVDLSPHPLLECSREDELNYALLRVSDLPGLISSRTGHGRPRGWLPLTDDGTLDPDAPLFILHHPKGGPMQVSMNMSSIIGVNPNGTRVRYRTNTHAGSAGAPCFDVHWNLAAIHQGTDPAGTYTYNDGIPVTAIRKLLQARGKLDLIERHARVAPFLSPFE